MPFPALNCGFGALFLLIGCCAFFPHGLRLPSVYDSHSHLKLPRPLHL
jgi:hypothetical protein